ncbi:MAG: DUF6931 family protein [Isosphaeraceae bacterium]
MPPDQPRKSLEDPAAGACESAGPGDEARALLAEGMTVRAYLDAMAAQGLHLDALRVLAQALPKREAVWWACLVAAEALGSEPTPEAAAALEVARAWVIDPTDENRRAAFPASQKAGLGTPVGCAAAAAYFSGGSLAPPEYPEVAPPAEITGKMVANAIMLAAVIREPEKADAKQAAFLCKGLEVAEGRHPWPQAAPKRPAAAARTGGADHAAARRPTY